MGHLRRYGTDLSDAAWALIAPQLPPAKAGGRPLNHAPRRAAYRKTVDRRALQQSP